MPWSDPDKGNDYNPWGKRTPPKSNNDLGAWMEKIRRQFEGLFGGRGGGSGGTGPRLGSALPYVIGILALLWLASGIYVVGPDEQGVVLRFGSHVDTTQPGLHYHLPYPIDVVYTPKVTESRRIEIGYRTAGTTRRGMPNEALMLTQDENIVDIAFAVQFRISNPSYFLFNSRDPETLVRQVAESSIRQVVGRSKIDQVLTEGRALIEQNVQILMQQTLDHYKLGLIVDAVRLQGVNPPEQVLPAFLDVVSAREDLQRARNEAEAYANDVLPRARGEAVRIVEEAAGYKQRSIEQATGDASRFSQILTEYRKAPRITSERLYLESMEEILRNANKVIVDSNRGNNVLYLPLDKLKESQQMPPRQQADNGQQQEAQPAQNPAAASEGTQNRAGQVQNFEPVQPQGAR
ncbi:FtsH protease activity modulator HflK [Thermithiobacillus plumbiphilus]|uniref:Protein HflK n=1 Tax=Thermithiobacillus plumbiphilus TaxID=1729899 RepID=A0ABU9DCZ3_9PROT